MKTLRHQIIRLANENVELRKDAGFSDILKNLFQGYKKEHPKSKEPPKSLVEEAKSRSKDDKKKDDKKKPSAPQVGEAKDSKGNTFTTAPLNSKPLSNAQYTEKMDSWEADNPAPDYSSDKPAFKTWQEKKTKQENKLNSHGLVTKGLFGGIKVDPKKLEEARRKRVKGLGDEAYESEDKDNKAKQKKKDDAKSKAKQEKDREDEQKDGARKDELEKKIRNDTHSKRDTDEYEELLKKRPGGTRVRYKGMPTQAERDLDDDQDRIERSFKRNARQAKSSSLRHLTIRLAHQKPELQPALRAILASASVGNRQKR